MGIFEPIDLEWKGENVRIPADQVMRAIACIEDVLTIGEIYRMHETGKIALTKLAMAYGAVLRFGGLAVKDEEIYAGMFSEQSAFKVMDALAIVLAMMIPADLKRDEATAGGRTETMEAKKKSKDFKTSERSTS